MGLVKKIVLLLLIFFVTGCTVSPAQEDYSKFESTLVITETKAIETQILNLINQHRISIGLNKLEILPIIKAVAHKHNIEMIEANKLSHNGFVERAEYLIYTTCSSNVAENLAYNYTTANSVFIAWMNSPGHRKNIEGDFTYFEISVDENKVGKNYITNIFIKNE